MNKTTGVILNKVFITLNFIDNYGVNYNADDLNPIASNYSYMRILNADVIKAIGYELPPLPDQCIGGETYPIIGRIELKTYYGFRTNTNFSDLAPRLDL